MRFTLILKLGVLKEQKGERRFRQWGKYGKYDGLDPVPSTVRTVRRQSGQGNEFPQEGRVESIQQQDVEDGGGEWEYS